jgi:rhamnogalacturonan endolyase
MKLTKTATSIMLILLSTAAIARVEITTAYGNGADTCISNDGNKSHTYVGGSSSSAETRHYDGVRAKAAVYRFDISEVKGDLSGAYITLDLFSATRSRTMNLYALADCEGDAWNEASANYGNFPGMAEPYDDGYLHYDEAMYSVAGTIATVAGTDWNVLTTVTSTELDSAVFAADTNGLVTFLIYQEGSDSAADSYFITKEATNEGAVLPTLVFPNATIEEVVEIKRPRLVERLDRGTVAVASGGGIYVGWRMLGTETYETGYNVYRGDFKLNSTPITASTNFFDASGSVNDTYSIAAVVDGEEQELSKGKWPWDYYCHDIDLNRPAGGTTPDSVDYTYSPNDASVGDLDGDGRYEIVLKWDPSNSKDNAQSGYTGNVLIDAYTISGKQFWRIDLGINIRAGSHYTQFMVYDFDCDGYSELICKTADGTVDGLGNVIGNASADYRGTDGRILNGPEYLTVFDGRTGAALDTVDFEPARGAVSDWGDSYGNRCDRFLACVAYLDGATPSVVMTRGYYEKTMLAAYDWDGSNLSLRWIFDSDDDGNSAYARQGNHNLSVADVDGDGKDEIVFGSCTFDDDGTGLYSTGLGHGDAMHVTDMDPTRPGLEVWQCHESSAAGATYRDAATGEIIWEHYNSGDVGRCMAGQIDTDYLGYQVWSYAADGTYFADGTQISTSRMGQSGSVWWTADLQREMLNAVDGNGRNPAMDKWSSSSKSGYRLISLYSVPESYGTNLNNSTKANACLVADIIGDWREEMIMRSSDNTKLRFFTTTDLTEQRMPTLMHDSQYRLGIAWQNVAYNQPAYPSFYLGEGMDAAPLPDIMTITPRFNPADIVADGKVDLIDLAALTAQWTGGIAEPNADIAPAGGGDGVVNEADLMVFADNWLAQP